MSIKEQMQADLKEVFLGVFMEIVFDASWLGVWKFRFWCAKLMRLGIHTRIQIPRIWHFEICAMIAKTRNHKRAYHTYGNGFGGGLTHVGVRVLGICTKQGFCHGGDSASISDLT